MNTQTYRLVFNAARACVVAVAETARGCGKGGQAGGMRIKRRRGSSARRCKPKWPLAPVASNYFAIDSGVFAYATNTLTVNSGGNTNLVGAQLAGNTVKMDVGGDLNVVTLQDKSDFASEQHSSGFGISLCLPPQCAGGAPVTGSINKNDASIKNWTTTKT